MKSLVPFPKSRKQLAPKSGHPQRKHRCPLWAKSGHRCLFDHLVGAGEQCPLYPQKRTCATQLGMSALGHKRTSPHSINQSMRQGEVVASALVVSSIIDSDREY
jgi:hypothetical protein